MKHPVLQNRTRLIVWWLVWIVLGLGQSLLFNYAYGSFFRVIIPDTIVSFVLYSGIGLILWYPFNYFIASKTKPAVLGSNILISGLISVGLWVITTRVLMILFLPDDNVYNDYWNTTLPYRIGTGIFIFGLIILTYYLFMSLSNLAEKSTREARLESLVKETELKMLRSQINPHFLFNSLNSVSSLTITDPEKAREMVIKLSEFMRYALSGKDEKLVELKNELDNLKLYLEIEKVRFGSRLITEENVAVDCLEIPIPVMLLQPLYENAIKHGVYESTENIRIITVAERKGEFLEITISNNYDPASVPAKGTGTGILNVSRRLDLFYGKSGTITTKKDNGIFIVKLFIPFNPKK
jgi:two-component system LytT family sensor kinase